MESGRGGRAAQGDGDRCGESVVEMEGGRLDEDEGVGVAPHFPKTHPPSLFVRPDVCRARGVEEAALALDGCRFEEVRLE